MVLLLLEQLRNRIAVMDGAEQPGIPLLSLPVPGARQQLKLRPVGDGILNGAQLGAQNLNAGPGQPEIQKTVAQRQIQQPSFPFLLLG
ncbi:hypothetical protein D3C81_1770910 [compost metagenome]